MHDACFCWILRKKRLRMHGHIYCTLEDKNMNISWIPDLFLLKTEQNFCQRSKSNTSNYEVLRIVLYANYTYKPPQKKCFCYQCYQHRASILLRRQLPGLACIAHETATNTLKTTQGWLWSQLNFWNISTK